MRMATIAHGHQFFCRPSRDFYLCLTRYPAMNGWAIVIASLHDFVACAPACLGLRGASAARPRFRPHKNLSHQLYSPSARKRRPQRRQARPICRTPNQNIFQPRRGGIFRSLQTATMMSLLTELCPLLNGDATNMSALTGLGKSGFPPCSIRASCVARKSKLNSSRSSTANCLWILADSHGRRRSNWVETTVPRGQGAGRVRAPTSFLALTDQSPWGV